MKGGGPVFLKAVKGMLSKLMISLSTDPDGGAGRCEGGAFRGLDS